MSYSVQAQEQKSLFTVYNKVMLHYSDTELFYEITMFMNQAFPEWKTYGGLGAKSANFINTIIKEFEDKKQPQRTFLVDLYAKIASAYKEEKQAYQHKMAKKLAEDFEYDLEDELKRIKNLPAHTYAQVYDKMYIAYKKDILAIEFHDFV